MVIVESPYGNEGTQRGGSTPDDVAPMLLVQLLRAAKSRGRRKWTSSLSTIRNLVAFQKPADTVSILLLAPDRIL
jgi:hypothetical protein